MIVKTTHCCLPKIDFILALIFLLNFIYILTFTLNNHKFSKHFLFLYFQFLFLIHCTLLCSRWILTTALIISKLSPSSHKLSLMHIIISITVVWCCIFTLLSESCSVRMLNARSLKTFEPPMLKQIWMRRYTSYSTAKCDSKSFSHLFHPWWVCFQNEILHNFSGASILESVSAFENLLF